MYSKRRNIKKHFLTLMIAISALSLILGYAGSTGSVKAATDHEELEHSLVLVSEEVKLSVVSITTVKVFKHPSTGGGGYHGDQYGRGRGDRRGRQEIRLMIFLTSLCQKRHQRESTRHKALVPV